MRSLKLYAQQLIIALSLILPGISAGAADLHKGSIEGLVLDAADKSSLVGATVRLLNTDQFTYTNHLGYFSFTDLPPGVYSIGVTYVGFKTDTLTSISVSDGTSTPVRFFLEPDQIDLPSVEVHANPSRNLNTISALDLHTRPIANAQEMLRLVPGLMIAQHAGGGKAEQLFLRGFDIDHGTDIQISVDGLPVNMVSHAHGQGYADLHFVIPELVRSLDFRKGPYYADLGNFATAGAVQLQTVDALDESFIKLEGGSFDSYRAVAGFNLLSTSNNQLRQRAYAAGEMAFSNGYFETPQHFNRFNFITKYNLIANDKQSLTLQYTAFGSRWDASGQIPERAVSSGLITPFGAIDPTEGGNTSRSNLSMVYFNNLNPSLFTRQQVYYTDYRFELYSNFSFFARDPQNGDQIRQREHRSIYGYEGAVHHSGKLGGIQLESEAGAIIRMDKVKDNELSYTKNREITLEQVSLGHVEEWNAALYGQCTAWLSPVFSLQAGLRFDQFVFGYDDLLAEGYQPQYVYKKRLSPKLNLQYLLNDRWQLFAQSGIGFHSNDTRVVVAQSGRQVLPAAYGLEAGLTGKPAKNLFVQFAFWRLDLDQEFIYVGDEGIVEPGGKTRRLGFDASARLQLRKWLYADADVNYAFARELTGGGEQAYIPLAPVLTSSGGLTANMDKGFSGSIRYRFMADRPANSNNSLTADGFFLLDATLRHRHNSLEWGLTAQNLLNTAWKEAQFETTSQLPGETTPVTEIHYTPGTPAALRLSCAWYFD